MGSREMLCLFMPDGGERGLIQVWNQGARSWIEFRGRPYSQWDADEDTPFSRIHCAMEGWHTTVLHTDQVLVLLPKHPDFERVSALIKEAETA